MRNSVICACKDRVKALLTVLPSWLHNREISEIVLVDWSSSPSLDLLVALDPRIKVIRVKGQQWFNQPQPLNLAASIASGDYILKLDTDFIINPYYSFFDRYKIDKDTFLSGDNDYTEDRIAHSPYFEFLRGLLWVNKEAFNAIGGYNESMGRFYAWEDNEIDIRLRMYGLNHRKIKYDHHIIHIPHPDGFRLKNFKGFDDPDYFNKVKNKLGEYYSPETLDWEAEYAITQHHIGENKKQFSNPTHWRVEPLTQWDVRKISDQLYEAKIK